MTRGPRIVRGRETALPIARWRGKVLKIQPENETPCDLMIIAPAKIIFVCVRRSRRLCGPVPDLEAEYREQIRLLRQVPSGELVAKELWLYSRYGTWRFLHIDKSGVVELGQDGTSLSAETPGPGKSH